MVCHKETRLDSQQDDARYPFVNAPIPLQFVAGIVALYTRREIVYVPTVYTMNECWTKLQ